MAKNNDVIEDALFQIKNLEESLNKNAQGILSSTMKNEIKSLVKESLKEQDEVEDEEEVDVDETDTDNEDEMGVEQEQDVDDVDDEMMALPTTQMDSEDDDTIDLTKASDSEVLRVFKAMDDEDGIIIKKDNNMLHLSDPKNDAEYLIQLAESESEGNFFEEDNVVGDMFEFDELYFDEEDLYGDDLEYDFEDEDEFGEYMEGFEDEDDYMPMMEFKKSHGKEEPVETIYELELDDEGEDKHSIEFMEDMSEFSGRFMDDEDEEELFSDELEIDEMIHEASKKSKMKAKGMGMGSASKFKYSNKPNQDYKPKKMKQGTRGVGMGKAKFEYKEEVNDEGFTMKPKTKKEFKEASRTYGNGSKSGRGLRKGITPNRNLTFENVEELKTLRAKNDEYRKALDLFRTKLNEVAIFNSNLAYATRLFTEHSTTKQEKINILRRFDNVDTLKESKNLYKNIKNELSSSKIGNDNTITESVQRTVSKAPSTGSAVSLIESKTYENPQFLRMKDLMGKLK